VIVKTKNPVFLDDVFIKMKKGWRVKSPNLWNAFIFNLVFKMSQTEIMLNSSDTHVAAAFERQIVSSFEYVAHLGWDTFSSVSKSCGGNGREGTSITVAAGLLPYTGFYALANIMSFQTRWPHFINNFESDFTMDLYS
jgi:hypothetical protein